MPDHPCTKLAAEALTCPTALTLDQLRFLVRSPLGPDPTNASLGGCGGHVVQEELQLARLVT